jgi:hypothetical protein
VQAVGRSDRQEPPPPGCLQPPLRGRRAPRGRRRRNKRSRARHLVPARAASRRRRQSPRRDPDRSGAGATAGNRRLPPSSRPTPTSWRCCCAGPSRRSSARTSPGQNGHIISRRAGVKAIPEVRIAHLNRILELGFRYGYIYKHLAEAHHDLGDDEQARARLNQAWAVDPNLAGAVRIAGGLGLSAPSKPLSPEPDEPALISLISLKGTQPQQVPTETQIRQWVSDGQWDKIIEHLNPAEYSPDVLAKARRPLRLIAIALGECRNCEGAEEGLRIMLNSFFEKSAKQVYPRWRK